MNGPSEPDPSQPGQPPPGYVPAPGGYGYVPADHGWAGSGPGPAAPGPAAPGTAAPGPAHPEPSRPVLANWMDRAIAGLIDFFLLFVPAVYFDLVSNGELWLLFAGLAAAWGLYNGYRQGESGQSVGKRVIGLRTVREADGQVLGGPAGFGRAFLHLLDLLPCGGGFLLPLWDGKRQTIADKIMGTLVIRS